MRGTGERMRVSRSRLTMDSSNINLPARAVRVSLQLSVACKSTFCQPFAASGPRARNNLYCPKHAPRRFTLANASTDEGHPACPHSLVRSRESRTAGPREKGKLNSSSSIEFATPRFSYPTRILIVSGQHTSLQDKPNLSSNTSNSPIKEQ